MHIVKRAVEKIRGKEAFKHLKFNGKDGGVDL